MAQPTVTVLNSTNASTAMLTFQDASSNNIPAVTLDNSRPTYRAAAARVVTITTSAKTLVTVTGSATKTVRISRIGIWITAGTAAEFVLSLQRVSAIGSGGTVVSPTVAKLDTGSAAATAVVSHYTTGAQSQGTAVGGLINALSFSQTVTTSAPTFLGSPPTVMMWPEMSSVGGQAIVLRGIADILEIQNLGGTGTTPATSYFVEWSEDGS